jgi:hypothetical protein
MWDSSIELGWPDRWVLTSLPRWRIGHWLESGLTRVPEEKLSLSIHAALAHVRDQNVAILWQQLFEYGSGSAPASVDELAHALLDAACGPIPRVIVLERLIERGFRTEPLVWKPRPLPPRTQTDHFVVVQAIDPEERPVVGLQLEVLIADGEIKSMQTDAEGLARVERVQAGRVVIRVLSVDGKRWRPLEEPAAQPSGSSTGLRWHVVRQGECLSRIAHQYGFTTWKDLWDHPKNEALRKRRKSPHVLHPGDQVAVPGLNIYQITRPTDATHRIEVDASAETSLRLRLVDPELEPFDGVAYELHYRFNGQDVQRPGRAPTDAGGWLEETLPLLARDVVVHLRKPPLSFAVAPGHLEPLQDEASQAPHASGIAQRLAALGYAAGPGQEALNERAQQALRSFQTDQLGRKEPNGDPDAETLSALTRAYGA